ncbi:MAG: YegP family protein [Candidatus Bathyarchaeota archaeon]|nr:MAG: YegP family protein [Candidatus Bathyarchaeota archaeon]
MVDPQFEITKDTSGEYRFRLRAPNGEIIANSEGYKSKSSCKKGIASVKKNAPKATIQDLTRE